ncbi:MAG: ComF family protein [Clostridiales bacterium]|nr:ComF family protein [Clostridiales bacterium]
MKRKNSGQSVFIYPHEHGIERSGMLLYITEYRPDNTASATNSLIYKLKYSATNKIYDFAAAELAGMLRKSAGILFSGAIPRNNIIVSFIPRRRNSILKYGYDHMEKTAKLTAAKLGFKYEKLITKTNEAYEQKRLGRKERFENAVQTTKIVSRHELSGKVIVLLDDIVTTGASISAAAELLLNAGASSIIAASIAATDHEL